MASLEEREKQLVAEIERLEKFGKDTDILVEENEKLKYQKNTLLKNIHAPRFDDNYFFDLSEYTKTLFSVAIKGAFPEKGAEFPVMTYSCPISKDHHHHYQCTSAMQIFALVKGKPGMPNNPKAVADLIIDNFPKVSVLADITVTGPGFIVIKYTHSFLTTLMERVYRNGVQPPEVVEKKRVLVDFSSPNIAKQMHVGHLRSTIIGDTLSRIFEFLGHEVLRVNHVGDWGTQFGMLICHLQDSFPNFDKEAPPIGDLQKFYQSSKKRFDEEEDFKKRAYEGVVKLQQGDEITRKAWTLICDESRKEFQRIYDKLDIKLEETGESFYQSLMAPMVELLESKGLVTVEDGRKLVYLTEGKPPLTVEKSDGGYTYDTSDMAAVNYRLNDLKVDWAIYVVDSGQALHFELVFACAKKVGIIDEKKHRVEHVGFGVVLDAHGKKFKTRSGETVKLQDLLDKAVEHATKSGTERAAEKDKDTEDGEVAEITDLDRESFERIAYAAVKYADLKNKRTSDYSFSFDRMMSLKGDTAARMLYSYARIASIYRKFGPDDTETLPPAKTFQHPSEIQLMQQALKFPEIIKQVQKDLMPHSLCDFILQLSNSFNSFYRDCKVVEKKDGVVLSISTDRLILCDAVSKIFKQSFNLLGITPVEKM